MHLIKRCWRASRQGHRINYVVIGILLGLISGFYLFHRESSVDKRLREIAEASYPDDSNKQRQALREFRDSLDELYSFSQNGGVEQARLDALDAEGKNDINTIYSVLESGFASNGYYPGEVNQTNLDGIAYEALVDKTGNLIASEYTLEDSEPFNTFGSQAPEPRYRYAGYDCLPLQEVVACQHYVLFAWLESGNIYTKKSIN